MSMTNTDKILCKIIFNSLKGKFYNNGSSSDNLGLNICCQSHDPEKTSNRF